MEQLVTLAGPENRGWLRKGSVSNEETTGWPQNRAQRTLAENGPGETAVPYLLLS